MNWYFTLATSHGGPGYVEVTASTKEEAREKMIARYGRKWAFQYDSLKQVHRLDRIKKGEIK